MPSTFTYTFDNEAYKGTTTLNTGLFIDGKWTDAVEGGTIDVVNPANRKLIVSVAGGTSKDVDIAVAAAKKAYKTAWGLKVPGAERGRLLSKLADLLEKNADEFAALESLNVGKVFSVVKVADVKLSIDCFRYYAGWADKIQGKSIQTTDQKLAYTRHEPYGVVGQIIPWNFPLSMLSWKIAPALATGNTVVLKPSELTPMTALRFADLVNEAGIPPGVVNIVNGYGYTVGQAISEHPQIEKIAFTGSTLTGRKILRAAADSNLKVVTLELGGKSPTIVFDDADLDQAVKWAAHGIFFNMGQVCTAGSRIFLQHGIYDEFLAKFTQVAAELADATGDPFTPGVRHGPQVSEAQFERIMGYIESGKASGAKVHFGGERHGDTGLFIKPTIFTECTPSMKIMREEIFGPVCAVMRFQDEDEVVELANDTFYGLGCNLFSRDASRAIRVAHVLEAGSVWVNCAMASDVAMPFGGYKQSGIGREMGEYAIETYTQVKGVHINIGHRL